MKSRLILFLSLAISFAQAQEATLKVGSPAPSLNGAHWIKGDKVTEFKKGHVYVIEFWATWCGPCRMEMPHLSELANEYKGKVTVMSFNIMETAYSKDKRLDYFPHVKEFVRKLGDGMDYNVAIDGPEKLLLNNWMKAAGYTSIPKAFIIGQDQRIAWIGHPGSMDDVLAAVVDNNYNEAQMEKMAAENKVYSERWAPINQRLRMAMEQKDYAKSVAIADTILTFAKPSSATYIKTTRFTALSYANKAAARKYGEQLIKELRRDPITLYSVGREILDLEPQPGFQPDYELGMKFVRAAASRSDSQDLPVLNGLAKGYYRLGNPAEAVKIQKQAIDVINESKFMSYGDATRKRAEKALEDYEAAFRQKQQ